MRFGEFVDLVFAVITAGRSAMTLSHVNFCGPESEPIDRRENSLLLPLGQAAEVLSEQAGMFMRRVAWVEGTRIEDARARRSSESGAANLCNRWSAKRRQIVHWRCFEIV